MILWQVLIPGTVKKRLSSNQIGVGYIDSVCSWKGLVEKSREHKLRIVHKIVRHNISQIRFVRNSYPLVTSPLAT